MVGLQNREIMLNRITVALLKVCFLAIASLSGCKAKEGTLNFNKTIIWYNLPLG